MRVNTPFLLILLGATVCGAADFYVDPLLGDDTGPGTQARPWKTLRHAGFTATSASDTIHALPGTYSPATGEIDATVLRARLVGSGPARTRLVDVAIVLDFDGAQVEAVGFTRGGVAFWGGNVDRVGFPPDERAVRDCRLEGTTVYISTQLARELNLRATIERNEFVNCSGAAVEVGWGGADSWDASQILRVDLRNNTVRSCWGLLRYDPDRAPIPGWLAYLTIVNNTVVSSSRDAVYLAENAYTRIAEAVISNNIFKLTGGYAVNEVRLQAQPTVQNNLFAGPNALYFDALLGPLQTVDDVNLMPGASGNVQGDAVFVDETAGDLRLALGSPGIDAGWDPSAPPDDFAGDVRPLDGDGDLVERSDIGADELRAGAQLLRNSDVTLLDPLTPPRAVVLPLRSPRDDFGGATPLGGFEDPGILGDTTRPLVLYVLLRPGNDLFLTKTAELRLTYGPL